MAIFTVDSPMMRFLDRVGDLMVLNLLFLVTSLPVVTLGASLTALNATTLAITTGRCDSVWRHYLTAWRSNFRAGTLLGLISGAVAAALWAWFRVIDAIQVSSTVRFIAFGVLIFVIYRFIATMAFVFSYQATFDDRVLTVLNNSRRMSAKHPLAALSVVVVTVLPILIGIYFPQVFVWGIVWVAFGFAAIAFVNATTLVRVFQRYGLSVDTIEDDPADTADALVQLPTSPSHPAPRP